MAKGIAGSTPTGIKRPVKTTLVFPYDVREKIKYIALLSKGDMSSMATEHFEKVIAKYEKQHGVIPIK